MVKKILNLGRLSKEELSSIHSEKLEELYSNLNSEAIDFFSKHDLTKYNKYDKVVFNILRLEPGIKHGLQDEHIRIDYFQRKNGILHLESDTYDFNLKNVGYNIY